MSRKKYNDDTAEDIVFDEIAETTEEIVTDNEEDIVEDITVSENIISCKVIKTIANNKAIIDFNGFGLIVSINKKVDFVNVKYTGSIGTPDFKYEVV